MPSTGEGEHQLQQPNDLLPIHATPASHYRYCVAQELAELCPPVLGQEISLTGSVSKGLADDFSDIEQVFYVQKLPAVYERDHWLKHIGAKDIFHDDTAIEDGSIWSTFRFRDVWIEAGWQTYSQQEELLHDILAGRVLDHHRLILAEITTHALPLRSKGSLSRWQQQLIQYPPQIAYHLVAEATELWKFPHLLASRWALLQRDEPWRLAEILVRETHNILRILFAVSHQWEPEWKWIRQATATLVIQPKHLMERIEMIWSPEAAPQRLTACFQLIHETLTLLPAEYNVAAALSAISEASDLYSS